MSDPNYIEHYGVKGMKWKKKKAIQSGNQYEAVATLPEESRRPAIAANNDAGATKNSGALQRTVQKAKQRKENRDRKGVTSNNGQKRKKSLSARVGKASASQTTQRGQAAINKMLGK